jgi:hypothetical protein
MQRFIVAVFVMPIGIALSVPSEHGTSQGVRSDPASVAGASGAAEFAAFATEIRRASELLALTGQCFHECRTDHCAIQGQHDIVESANPNSTDGFETELEQCGEHMGETCAWHECGQSFAGGVSGIYDALETLRMMPAGVLIAAVSSIPALDVDPTGNFVQLIGCGGRVIANLRIPA